MTRCKSVLGGQWWHCTRRESQPSGEAMRGKVETMRTNRKKREGLDAFC